jgi:hypothetical protein
VVKDGIDPIWSEQAEVSFGFDAVTYITLHVAALLILDSY